MFVGISVLAAHVHGLVPPGPGQRSVVGQIAFAVFHGGLGFFAVQVFTAGILILWTYARSTKTFQGSLRLCAAGYGEQAGMLNRSLYEDMLIAHWVKRHPTQAPDRLDEHETYTLANWGRALRNHDLLSAGVKYPTLTKKKRQILDRRFRGKTWTGLTLPQLLRDVRDEWSDPIDQRILAQVNDIVNRFNNILLHHGGRALSVIGQRDPESGKVTFNVGPSDTHIWGGLFGAYFTYANTASLVYSDDLAVQLAELYSRHIRAFTTEKTRPSSG